MKKKSILETFEKTGDIPEWKPAVGYNVDVFEDVMTQHKHEGVAKIVKVHSKRNGILDCDVRFYMHQRGTGAGQLEEQVVRRQIKYLK